MPAERSLVSIYYQDERVTLYRGDSLEILPTLDVQADALLTDPPYFKVKNEDWDRQWAKPDEFLRWIGSFLDAAKPLLAPHASVWVFASPQMCTDVELAVRDRFRVLNSVRWVKPYGTHNKASLATLRSFLSPWEAIIFGEHYGTEETYQDRCLRLWGEIAAPLRDHIEAARVVAELTRRDIDRAWQAKRGTRGMMTPHWFGGGQWQLPGEAAYEWMRADLGMALMPYSEARREYDELRAEFYKRRQTFDDQRRHFDVTERALSTDIWDFAPVRPYPGKHPCEKPAPLLRHMIETSTRPGALILDPFAGSGSTLEVAAATGRHAIGIEKSEEYCEKIAHRLSTRTEQYALI